MGGKATRAELQQMAQLWAEGRSTAEIGEIMGRSSSAICGYAHRNRDLFRPRSQGEAPQRTVKLAGNLAGASTIARPQAKAETSRAPAASEARLTRPHFPLDPKLALEAHRYDLDKHALPGATPVPFRDLEAGQCKFALQPVHLTCGPDTLFCAAPTAGKPYCPAHRAIVYGRVQDE